MLDLWCYPTKRAAVVAAGRKRVENKFSFAVYRETILGLYEYLLRKD